MKKSIIALAVMASVAGIAQADTTLYGSIRTSVEYTDVDSRDGGTLEVVDQASRFGIKGSEDLGNGLAAVYQYEFGVNSDIGGLTSDNRLSWVGLTGGFGTFALGKQWSPYYNTVGYNDIFNGSESYALYQGPFRLANAVAYVTPEMGGFSASAAVILGSVDESRDDAGNVAPGQVTTGITDEDYIDAWNIAASWTGAGVFAGLSYLGGADDGVELFGAAVGYSNDMFRIGFVVEDNIDGLTVSKTDSSGNFYLEDADALHYNLAGEFYLGESDTIRGGVAYLDNDDLGEVWQYVVGYEHKFSKRTLLWAEYAYLDLQDGQNADNDDNSNLVSVGLRHDF